MKYETYERKAWSKKDASIPCSCVILVKRVICPVAELVTTRFSVTPFLFTRFMLRNKLLPFTFFSIYNNPVII